MFPIRHYQARWLRGDVVAGVTVAAIAIPESLGYAGIVGLPIEAGLYTALLAPVVFAVLASSRQLVVGADSATAAIVAAGAAMLAGVGTQEYAGAVALTTLVGGAVLLLMAVLRLGFLADLISAPVLAGFLSGVGVSLIIGKLPGMLQLEASGSTWEKLTTTVQELGDTNPTAAVLSLTVVAVMLGLERLRPKLPAALFALAAATVLAAAVGAQDRGVQVVGAIPAGLPQLSIPTVQAGDVLQLLGTGIALAVVILAQSAAVARSYASRNDYHVNEDADLFALGAANVASSITGGFSANGSPPRTAAGDEAGSRSQLVNIVMALTVALVLLFATGLFDYIPTAVLDAVVFAIGIRLIRVADLRRVASYRRSEFATALICLVAVAFVGVEQGVLLAVLISVADRLRRQYRPNDEVLASPLGVEERLLQRLPDGRALPPDILVYRYGTSLFFENAANFTSRVNQLLRSAGTPIRLLVLDLAAMSDLDYTGVATLRALAQDLSARGTTIVLTELAPEVGWVVAKSGLKDCVEVVPRMEDAVFAEI